MGFIGIVEYRLILEGFTQVEMPFGAKLLTARVRRGVPYLCAFIYEANLPEIRHIRIAQAGEQVNDRVEYIGTFQLSFGGPNYYVFEMLPN